MCTQDGFVVCVSVQDVLKYVMQGVLLVLPSTSFSHKHNNAIIKDNIQVFRCCRKKI